MKKLVVLLILFILFISTKGISQALSPEDVKSQLIKEWERAKVYTTEYLNAMPADKYSFKAVDSIRSFAQQMLHLASGNIFLVSAVSDIKAPEFGLKDLEQRPGAQTRDSVMYYVLGSYDYCLNALKASDVNKWGEIQPRFKVTRFAVFLKAFEHQTHHRGQTTIYIRLLGIRPPGEKLF
jgi:hypothetical protein